MRELQPADVEDVAKLCATAIGAKARAQGTNSYRICFETSKYLGLVSAESKPLLEVTEKETHIPSPPFIKHEIIVKFDDENFKANERLMEFLDERKKQLAKRGIGLTLH